MMPSPAVPSDPAPADPAPTDPAPVNPGPANPGPANPGPANPGPTDPGPADPGPTDMMPDDMMPTDMMPDDMMPDDKMPDDMMPMAGMDGGDPPSGDCLCRGDDPTESSILADGPYNVDNYSSGFAVPSGVTSLTVWHPTDAEPPFAGIAIVPGFVSPESSIRQWGPFLASHGIVTVTIGVPGGDQPRTRATKLMGTIESIKGEHTRSGSPLEGKIDLNRMALAGWSMGGGGTLIASASNGDTITACMSFAAWGPSGGGMNQVPCLMFEATADVLAANMSDGFYRAVPDSVPKMLFEVQGSSHNVANSPRNHNNVIGAYGLSWMKTFLEGDERYRQFLTRPFPSIVTSKSAHNL